MASCFTTKHIHIFWASSSVPFCFSSFSFLGKLASQIQDFLFSSTIPNSKIPFLILGKFVSSKLLLRIGPRQDGARVYQVWLRAARSAPRPQNIRLTCEAELARNLQQDLSRLRDKPLRQV